MGRLAAASESRKAMQHDSDEDFTQLDDPAFLADLTCDKLVRTRMLVDRVGPPCGSPASDWARIS